MPLAEKNKKQMTAMDTYAEVAKSVTSLGCKWKLAYADVVSVQIWRLTYTMTHEETADRVECSTQVILSSISENMTFHIMYE